MKAVSVTGELLVIERAIEAVADRLDVEAIDDPLTDDAQRRAVAVLRLASVRLRDLSRAARGRLPVGLFWAPHNGSDPSDEREDLILYEPAPSGRRGRK